MRSIPSSAREWILQMPLAVTSIAKYYKKIDEKVTLKLATLFLTKDNLKEESFF